MVDFILYNYMDEMLKHTPQQFYRYLFDKIDWNSGLTGIVGPRGVGKSTMLKQYILQTGREHTLYVSADNTYFANHSLVNLADEFVKDGGKRLFIDEIHKYEGWSRELKQINDVYSDLLVVFTGSSVLDIHKGNADLSRRSLIYELQGLSFREYLEMFHSIKSPTYSLEEIIDNKVTVPEIEHPLPLFRKYLEDGYYPFSSMGNFSLRMNQIINQTIEVDIAQYADLKAVTVRKLKRLLIILSKLVPFKPSIESLAKDIGVSKNNLPEYLMWFEKAGLLGLLCDDTGGIRNLSKVEKIYLDNPSLMTVLAGSEVDQGNVRETFFYNQMRVMNNVSYSKLSDFRIGDILFEIGGKNKGFKQLKDADRGIVVKDNIEIGHQDIVPLWAFGFNY